MSSKSLTESFRNQCSLLPGAITGIVVGLSGGVDSVTLLHLIHSFRNQILGRCTVQAVYVHHGLNSQAGKWSEFCAGLCAELQIPFFEERVQLDVKNHNIEAQAREKRYQALAKHLDCSSVLATAHHLNDVAETFFIALKRGAGLPGLSTMGVLQPFGESHIWRPLLEVSRSQIEQYAAEHNLSHITDDSNFDIRYDRNFFRHEIIPKIVEHFPEFLDSVKKSSSYIYESQLIVRNVALQDLCELEDRNGTLDLSGYRLLPAERQHNALRTFIHRKIKKYPSAQLINQFERDFLSARDDANPVLKIDEWELRKFKDHLYAVRDCDLNRGYAGAVKTMQIVEILNNRYQLVRSAGSGFRLPEGSILTLSYDYSFSLKIHPQDRRHGRELKKLFMEYEIPQWQRKITPIVEIDGKAAGLFPDHIDRQFFAERDGYVFKKLEN